MSRKKSTANMQRPSSRQYTEWDHAIVAAEKEVRRAERRIAELHVSIPSLRRLRKNWVPFPSGPSDASMQD
jgi:predicted dithiol-disulfide oxidoreductase (DUF899 family)